MQKQTIQEILNQAGYDNKFTNRQRNIRSINSVLANTEIKLFIATKGKCKVGNDGFKYNVRLQLQTTETEVASTRLLVSSVTEDNCTEILKALGKFLQRDNVKNKITSYVTTPHKCAKCEGKGHIPAFDWYANGICFDCLGLGIVGVLSVEVELKGVKYLKQFMNVEGRGFIQSFPQGVQPIKSLKWANTESAEMFLGQKDNNFYIYQPVCMSNTWYTIPASEFEKFKLDYNYYIESIL
jgi:hypothetical protein